MRLDSKSARKIATGLLKTQEEDINSALQRQKKQLAPSVWQKGTPRKGASAKRFTEEYFKKIFGNTLIGGGWASRAYCFFIFEIQKTDVVVPLRLLITGWSFNTRSNAANGHPVALITMHAMERLMERRRDTDLIRLARDEFDLDFISKIVFGENGDRLSACEDFEIKTRNGWARGIVGDNNVPVVKTWIHKPGGWDSP